MIYGSDLYHDFLADEFSRTDFCKVCGSEKEKDGNDLCLNCQAQYQIVEE